MAIDGVSQSTGVERIVEVTRSGEGVQLLFRERKGNVELERIVLPTDDLMNILTERPTGLHTIDGKSAAGKPLMLNIEVKRNEVLLVARAESVAGCDAAVGLDDLTDALESVTSAT